MRGGGDKKIIQEILCVSISFLNFHSSNKASWNFASLDITKGFIANCSIIGVKNDDWVQNHSRQTEFFLGAKYN